MKYNPEKHHRRSIRLRGYDYTSAGMYFITICTYQRQCLFGDIVEGEMRLNELGEMINARWQRLPFHFPNLQLDAFVVMPNHIHGILWLTDPSDRDVTLPPDGDVTLPPGRGAALDQESDSPTEKFCSNATPHCDRLSEPGVAFGRQSMDVPPEGLPNADGLSEPGVAFGRESMDVPPEGLPNAAPLPPCLVSGSVGAIVLNFKSVTTRLFNRMKRSPGIPLWQRNYYEHIIRSEASLHRIRQYIDQNPLSWQQDQLHPDHPSKW